jgi:hypothetical protein
MQPDAALLNQLARLKAEVERDGGTTIDSEERRLLCPDSMTGTEQFMRIAGIAQREGWSFAFLPDGTVRFGAYAAA